MMWSIVVSAIGLLFVFEGLMPFVAPGFWRRLMQQAIMQSDRALHIMGLLSMLAGLALVCIARDL